MIRPAPGLRSRARRSGLLAASATILGAVSFGSPPVPATTITIPLRLFEVSSVDDEITTVAVGDRFVIRFIVDDSVTDSSALTTVGNFDGLVTAVEMGTEPGNQGSWAPSGVVDLENESQFATLKNFGAIQFRFAGTGFPDGAPDLFFDELTLYYDWPNGITDNGLGATFADHLGPAIFDIPPAEWRSGDIVFEFDDGSGFQYYANLVDLTIFLDGFEIATTCRWSFAQPADCD